MVTSVCVVETMIGAAPAAPTPSATTTATTPTLSDVDLRNAGGVPLDGGVRSPHGLRAEAGVAVARFLEWSRPADRVAAEPASRPPRSAQLSRSARYLSKGRAARAVVAADSATRALRNGRQAALARRQSASRPRSPGVRPVRARAHRTQSCPNPVHARMDAARRADRPPIRPSKSTRRTLFRSELLSFPPLGDAEWSIPPPRSGPQALLDWWASDHQRLKNRRTRSDGCRRRAWPRAIPTARSATAPAKVDGQEGGMAAATAKTAVAAVAQSATFRSGIPRREVRVDEPVRGVPRYPRGRGRRRAGPPPSAPAPRTACRSGRA
jgi:hypothetical protein